MRLSSTSFTHGSTAVFAFAVVGYAAVRLVAHAAPHLPGHEAAPVPPPVRTFHAAPHLRAGDPVDRAPAQSGPGVRKSRPDVRDADAVSTAAAGVAAGSGASRAEELAHVNAAGRDDGWAADHDAAEWRDTTSEPARSGFMTSDATERTTDDSSTDASTPDDSTTNDGAVDDSSVDVPENSWEAPATED